MHEIYRALIVDNPERLSSLLKETTYPAIIEGQSVYGFTPLEFAVAGGKERCVPILIAAGANVKHGRLLNLAIKFDRGAIFDLLLAEGADVNFIELPSNTTPLIISLRHKYPEYAKKLLPKTTVKLGEALCAAVGNRYIDIVRELIDKGADVNIGRFTTDNPLHIAAVNSDGDMMVQLLVAGADPNLSDALIITAANGRVDIIGLLLLAEADLEQRRHQQTPLCAALINHQHAAVFCLISAGARLENVESAQWPPIIIAAYYGYYKKFNELYSTNDTVSYELLLEKAVSGPLPNVKIVYLLLERGVDLSGDNGKRILAACTDRETRAVIQAAIPCERSIVESSAPRSPRP